MAPVGPPRRCALKFLFVVGVLGLGALVFAYWYLVKCAGTWQGVPLESKHVADLQALKERLKADVAYLQDLGPRKSEDDTTYARLRTCAAWIAKEWQTQGYAVRTQEFTVGDKPYANLEIEIPGTTAPSEIVIISAQYDTLPGSPGANNNASGVATLLRLSELLKGRQGDRTVRLVQFVNEEEPFFGTEQMGSYVYARACRERGEDIRAMLSLDAIGIYKHTPGSQKLPWPFSWCYPDKGDFLAFIANAPSRGCVKVATRGFRKGSAFPIRAGVVPEWVDGATWSDHSSFWRLGYPGVQVTDTGALRSASHTTPEDTLEKIDFDALSRITLGIYGATLELARKENELSPLDLPSHWLFFNGVIVLLAGLLAGLALWQAILWNLPTAAY
ncbi:MAG: M28 family peptidase, partial [Verrucomicrobiales bacterium]|nr:M28 family peptidase [Verrucomicrobiales bacterium]